MAIIELFSKRQKKLREEIPDVYQYENIHQKFRVQVIQIISDTIGLENSYNDAALHIYEEIRKILCKEYGVFKLVNYRIQNASEDIFKFFLKEEDYEKCLDVIELLFKQIDTYVRNNYYNFQHTPQTPSDAINELNDRFKESGIGYQFESGELIRVDSQHMHSEVVKPVLNLLSKDNRYIGANNEFLSAHEHYLSHNTTDIKDIKSVLMSV